MQKQQHQQQSQIIESVFEPGPSDLKEETPVVAIDCEMVGVKRSQEALARVSIVNFNGQVLYDKYVIPESKIIDYRTWVSGVTSEHLKPENGAIEYQSAKKDVHSILKDKIVVGHSLHNDFKVLELNKKNQSKIGLKVRDTSIFPHFLKENGGTMSLKNLSEKFLSKKIQDGQHSSVDDARAALALYRINQKDFENFIQEKNEKDLRKQAEKRIKREQKRLNQKDTHLDKKETESSLQDQKTIYQDDVDQNGNNLTDFELEIRSLEAPHLIDVILSGQIFEPQFLLPAATKYLTLPDRFKSVKHFKKTWDIIFKAEQQSLLLKSKKRKAETKDERPPLPTFNTEEIPDDQNLLPGVKNRFMWTGSLVLDDVEDQVKYKNDRHAKLKVHQEFTGINPIPYNKKYNGSIRNNSLVILTLKKLNLKDDKKVENDIKQVVSQDFMTDLLQSGQGMLAKTDMLQKFPLKCEVDRKVLKRFIENREQNQLHTSSVNVYVYAYESFSTALREYSAIYRIARTKFMGQILDPRPRQDIVNQKQAKKSKQLQAMLVNLNESQKSAVMKINNMPENTIELIQGPPGTGKTHTISNLIAVFFEKGAKRVHVCTPSNTAADEVMLRLSKPGGVPGITQKTMDATLLRVGAKEYKATFPELQKYSLDERIKVILKVYEEEQLKIDEIEATRNIQQFTFKNNLPQLEKEIRISEQEIKSLPLELQYIEIQQEQIQELILQVKTTEIDNLEDANNFISLNNWETPDLSFKVLKELQFTKDEQDNKKQQRIKGKQNITFDEVKKIMLILDCDEKSAKQAFATQNGDWIKALLNLFNMNFSFQPIYKSKDILYLTEIKSELEAYQQDLEQAFQQTETNLIKAKKTLGRAEIEFQRPQKELQILKDKKIQILESLDTILKERAKINEQEEKAKILKKSRILVTTLSMAGTGLLSSLESQIDYLLIDEAGQCIEPSALIPFKLQPKRVILVGDQKQLPATTFMTTASETRYARSLFERMIDNNKPRTMLDIQYRMHPNIRAFPSNKFYDGKLTDGPEIATRVLIPELKTIGNNFSRTVFFDLMSKENNAGTSKSNIYEQDFTIALVEFLAYLSEDRSFKPLIGKIGIVSPYKAQVRELREKFKPIMKRHGCKTIDIEINTVDSYQGREKEIMIFNCVRSNNIYGVEPWKSLGFLTDERRLNVAITRPKNFLFIIGNERTLKISPTWKDLVDSHKQIEKGFFKLRREANDYRININLLFEVLSGQENNTFKSEQKACYKKKGQEQEEVDKKSDKKNQQDREKFTSQIEEFLKNSKQKILEFSPSLKFQQNDFIKKIVAQDYPKLKSHFVVEGQSQKNYLIVRFKKTKDKSETTEQKTAKVQKVGKNQQKTQSKQLNEDQKSSLATHKDLQIDICTLQKEQATQQEKNKQTKLVVKNFEKQIAAIDRKILISQQQVHPVYNKINLLDQGIGVLQKKLAQKDLDCETEHQLVAEIEKIRKSHVVLKEIKKLQVEVTMCRNKKATAEKLISERNKTLKIIVGQIELLKKQKQENISKSSKIQEKKPQTIQEQNISKQEPSETILIQKTLFENHEKVQRLDKGNFLVKNKKTKELECLKFIDIANMTQKEIQSLLYEARLQKTLDHKNIIKLKNLFRTKCQKMCFIFEYAESKNLASMIKNRQESNQKFSQTEIIGFMKQLCLAVQHMHDKDIHHLDLKPSHIYVMEDGTLIVGDFAISNYSWSAKSYDDIGTSTLCYMAPELIQSEKYSVKDDIWSLGVIFYELIMLKKPFESQSQQELQQLIIQGDFDRKITGVSQVFLSLILNCLCQDPIQRPHISKILKLVSTNPEITEGKKLKYRTKVKVQEKGKV